MRRSQTGLPTAWNCELGRGSGSDGNHLTALVARWRLSTLPYCWESDHHPPSTTACLKLKELGLPVVFAENRR